jgi:hypothetical protein
VWPSSCEGRQEGRRVYVAASRRAVGDDRQEYCMLGAGWWMLQCGGSRRAAAVKELRGGIDGKMVLAVGPCKQTGGVWTVQER